MLAAVVTVPAAAQAVRATAAVAELVLPLARATAVLEATVAAPLRSALYSGLIFEYREGGKLLGVMTGIERDTGIYLQHVMMWPGAPMGALVRMLIVAERQARERKPTYIVLDIENDHPQRETLTALAARRGYQKFTQDGQSTWFVKYEETR